MPELLIGAGIALVCIFFGWIMGIAGKSEKVEKEPKSEKIL